MTLLLAVFVGLSVSALLALALAVALLRERVLAGEAHHAP